MQTENRHASPAMHANSTRSTIFLGLAAGLTAISSLAAGTPPKLWESEAVLNRPESALFDEHAQVIYVSSMAGNKKDSATGFISKVSLDGKILARDWIAGLDSPKGMGLKDGALYAADIGFIDVIDVAGGKLLRRIAVEGARKLNDISVAPEGELYISDEANPGRVYRMVGDKVEIWLELAAELKDLNGIRVDGQDVLIGTRAGLYAVDRTTKQMRQLVGPSGFIDGLISSGRPGEYLITNNAGKVQVVGPNRPTVLVYDTSPEKISAADIEYVVAKKLLLVPVMNKNRLDAYRYEP
jgi:hypothetical protein